MEYMKYSLEWHKAHEYSFKLMERETMVMINDYVLKGWDPGGFLTAVLTNDLNGAFGRADIVNLRAMFSIVSYIHNFAPAGCHGSPEAVHYWLGQFHV